MDANEVLQHDRRTSFDLLLTQLEHAIRNRLQDGLEKDHALGSLHQTRKYVYDSLNRKTP